MKTWQIVILVWIVAAFSGVVVSQLNTSSFVDLAVCVGITLLATLLIRANRPKK